MENHRGCCQKMVIKVNRCCGAGAHASAGGELFACKAEPIRPLPTSRVRFCMALHQASSEKSVGHRYARMGAGNSACATREPRCGIVRLQLFPFRRSEEHTSELQSHSFISYA